MLPERFVQIADEVSPLAPVARAVELGKHIEAESDPEVIRLLEHKLRYTIREQSDADFMIFLEKRRKRARRKSQYSPEEMSALREEFNKQ